jgi:hypothetical protein
MFADILFLLREGADLMEKGQLNAAKKLLVTAGHLLARYGSPNIAVHKPPLHSKLLLMQEALVVGMFKRSCDGDHEVNLTSHCIVACSTVTFVTVM